MGPRDRSGERSVDQVPTEGALPVRQSAPPDTPGLLRRDHLLSPREVKEEVEEVDADHTLLVRMLLVGLVLFLTADGFIVAYKFGYLGASAPPAVVETNEAPPPPPPMEVPRRTEVSGVPIKEGISDGRPVTVQPRPAERLSEPPEM